MSMDSQVKYTYLHINPVFRGRGKAPENQGTRYIGAQGRAVGVVVGATRAFGRQTQGVLGGAPNRLSGY